MRAMQDFQLSGNAAAAVFSRQLRFATGTL
jgi:hypothetical protein